MLFTKQVLVQTVIYTFTCLHFSVSLVFGAVMMLSGIVGVPLGSVLSTKLKQRYPRADPIICGVGLLVSALLLSVGISIANWNIYVTFALLFLGVVSLNLNWSIVADILLVRRTDWFLLLFKNSDRLPFSNFTTIALTKRNYCYL